MPKTAGFGQFFALKAAVLSALLCAGSPLSANEQEQYIPADTHFFIGTGRKIPIEHMLALMPNMTLPKSGDDANSAETLEKFSAFIENPEEQLDKWGIDSDLQMSAYTVGIFPVMRLSLKDPVKFDSAVADLEKEHNIRSTLTKRENLSIRFYAADELSKVWKKSNMDNEGAENTAKPATDPSSAGLVLATDGSDLIVSFISDGEDSSQIDKVTGIEKPAKSIAESGKLKQLRKKWNYAEEMTAFVDFQQFAATLTGSESENSKQLQSLLEKEAGTAAQLEVLRSEPCRSEIAGLAESWPMIVSGTRKFEVSDKEVIYDSHLAAVVKHELLRESLMLLRGVVPTSQSSSQAMISVGLGITVDRLAQAVGQFSQLFASMNYQCSSMSGLNNLSQTDLSGASMGVVMFGGLARGVQGLSFNVFDVDVNPESRSEPVKAVDSAIAISAADPALLIQTLKMMPQLAMLAELPTDGSEISLNSMLPIPVPGDVDIKAAVKGKNIVIYTGDNGTDYANRLGGNDNEGFFEMQVDTRLLLDKFESVIDMAGPAAAGSEGAIEFMKSYPKGKIDYSVDFTAEGIEINSGGIFDRPER